MGKDQDKIEMPWARPGTKHTPVATTRFGKACSVTASTQAWPQAGLPRAPRPRARHRHPQATLLAVPTKLALTCQPPPVPGPPGQAASRKRGQEVQPHGECGREVPPRGRPRQPRVRRLGAPKPPAVQHGGPGSSGRPGGRRAPVAAVPARQPGAGREQVLLALAQPPSSPFPRPARSTSLAQTPATTGRSHWPQPRASGQRTGTPARFLNLRHDSPSRQMAQHGDQDLARSPGQTRSARPGRWTDLGSNPLRRWPAACCGQAR